MSDLIERLRARVTHEKTIPSMGHNAADRERTELITLLTEAAAALRQAALVPEAKHPDDGNGDDGAYNRGWNDCREAMLATHPAAGDKVREVDDGR